MQSSTHPATTADSRCQKRHTKSETHRHPPQALPTVDARPAPDTTHTPCACHPAKNQGEPSSSFLHNGSLCNEYRRNEHRPPRRPAPPCFSRTAPCREF